MKNNFKKIFLTLAIFVLPVLALAAPIDGSVNGGGTGTTGSNSASINIDNPAKGAGNDLISILTTILERIVAPIAAIAVVMYIIYAGFTFLTAQGKPAEIDKAKQRLLWALIGAGILLGAAGIAKVVQTTVGQLFQP